jgi:adenylate cyclase
MPSTIIVLGFCASRRTPAWRTLRVHERRMSAAGAIDFAAEGLLDGLEGAERREREALLRRLASEGTSLAELRRATESGALIFLPTDRLLVGDERYTQDQIAELSGVEREFLEAARRAMGLPIPEADSAEAIYSDAELESARQIKRARDAGVANEDILELSRVLGRALSQVAEALRRVPLKRVLEPGISEYELAQRYAAAVKQLHPLVEPLLSNALTLYLRQTTQIEVVSAMERSGGRLPGSREVTVCFADLVGFTRLGEEVPAEELGQLAARLESLAGEVAEPPVRLVKTIGDAAMLASPRPEPVLDAALRLLDAADAEGNDFPQLRAGAAVGRAVPRAGDWFGRPVNLASRITAIARPGSLLTEREVREAAREEYRFSYAGDRRLRGIREPVRLYRVRRLQASDAGEGSETAAVEEEE